jgi:hypothetical protein
MIRPVTSTSVATNGADEVAGSKPKRRNAKGSIDPTSVPQSTMPTSASPTVKPTPIQCSPYRLNPWSNWILTHHGMVGRLKCLTLSRQSDRADHLPPIAESQATSSPLQLIFIVGRLRLHLVASPKWDKVLASVRGLCLFQTTCLM